MKEHSKEEKKKYTVQFMTNNRCKGLKKKLESLERLILSAIGIIRQNKVDNESSVNVETVGTVGVAPTL